MWVCLAPILPIWLLSRFGEGLTAVMDRLAASRWAQACVRATDAVERWQREPVIQGKRIITAKSGDRVVIGRPEHWEG